jgi:hypothetical protein
VCLELHRIGTCARDLVDEGVRIPKAPVMGKSHLGDDETAALL